jgi:predicted nucleotidyltransferase
MTTPLSQAARDEVAGFCRRWGVSRLWLFGSAARGEAGPASDIDLLAEFLPESTASTWDWPRMTAELEAIFGRPVDLLSVGILENPFRRASIEASREMIYAAA